MGAGHTFLGEWVGDVGGPALNETLTSRDGLHVWGAPLEALRWNPPLLAEILITSWFPTQNLLT